MNAASEPTPSYGRAGRDLPKAIAVGLGLLSAVGMSLWLATWLLAIIVAIAAIVAVLELHRAMSGRGIAISRRVLVVAAPVMILGAFVQGDRMLVVAFGATVLATLLTIAWRGADGFVRDATASAFVAAYVPFMLGFAMLMLREEDGAARVLALVLFVAASDTGGYVAGVFFGRHPLAPRISPKKSWEGLIGSVILSAAVGGVYLTQVMDRPWWHGVVMGVVLAGVATLGDLAESLIKRDLGIKDMSHLLPGHGGIMDRLDSVIPTAFATWALFSVLGG